MTSKVMAFVAHADDEVLGVGGTLLKHKAAGDEVWVVIAADCRTARAAKKPTLSEAAKQASALMGSQLIFLGHPALTLARAENVDLTHQIDVIIGDIKPDIVYTHYPYDPNNDHKAVANAVMVATRPPTSPQRVLCFETPSSTEWFWQGGFSPNVFVELCDSLLEKKLAVMKCYEEELRPAPHPRGLEALRTRAAYWGQVAGLAHAEPFVLMREIVR